MGATLAHIDYFMIPLSTFAYLAGDGLEKIAAKHGATITYKPFNLLKVFDDTGTPRAENRHPFRQAYRLQEITRISKRANLPINLHPAHWPVNPVPSSCAIIAAQKAGGGDIGGLVQSIMRACWAEDKDISVDEVIIGCLEANGFSADLLNSGMLSGAETYGANTEEAMKRGVFGSPSYLVDDQIFWGQDRLSYLDKYLAERG